MAASSRASRFMCAVRGHDWSPGTPLHGHDFCRRCKRYDDAPGMTVGRDRWFRFQSWCPIWPKLGKHGASLRLGWAWRPFTAHVSISLHWGWDRTAELPGITVSSGLWRLRFTVGLGHGWQDEDGEERSLFYVQARVITYGLRYVGCWLGHDFDDEALGGYVYCRRCDYGVETTERSCEDGAVAA